MRQWFTLFATAVLICSATQATVIAERTGWSSGSVNTNDPEGVSWTQAGSYTNVAISAFLSSAGFGGNGTGTVYLTNRIGSGTTTANQIAETTVTGLGFDPSAATNLFSGLSLGAGAYYLITASNLGGDGPGMGQFPRQHRHDGCGRHD